MIPRTRLALALLGAVPAALGAQERTVTLAEALQLAERVQPGLVQARGGVRSASAGVRSNTGTFLPSLNADAGSFRTDDVRIDPGTGRASSTTYSAGFGLNLDLWDGFRRFNERKAANADVTSANATLRNQQFQVALTTKQIFYTALASEELVKVAERSVQRFEQQLAIAIDKLRAGAATRSDSLRSRVELGNAQLALLRAEADFAAAQANLGRQVGIGGRVRAAADTTLLQPVPPLDVDQLVTEATSTAPRVVEADASARAAGAQVAVAKSQYWPTFAASYSNGINGRESPWSSLADYQNDWSLRFSLRWTVFNGFQREGQVTNAAVQRDNAQAAAAEAKRAVHAEVIQLAADLESAGRQIEIADASREAAREDLRVQSERYRVGASTILEVLTSQVALDQAEVDAVRSRYDYVIARAQLEALIGRSL